MPGLSRAFNQRGRLRRLTASDQFDQALTLAIERGWLKEARLGLVLTAAGASIGRRARTGMHRGRLGAVGLEAAARRLADALTEGADRTSLLAAAREFDERADALERAAVDAKSGVLKL